MARMKDEKSDASPADAIRARLREKYDSSVAPTVEDMVPRPLPTGIPQLDAIIGIGGLPRGRIIDVFGQEAVGKTALHMLIAKNLLRINPSAQICWIDVEHKLSTSLAKVIGLDLEKILVIHPPSAEDSFDMLLDLIADFDSFKDKGNKARSPKPLDTFDLIVYDSVAAAVAQAELMSEADDHNVAPIARLMANTLKKMLHPLFGTRTVVSFINQMRSTPMVRTYGNQVAEKPTGGKALPFYATVRLQIKKSEYIKEGKDNIVGLRNEVETVKNGVAAPFQTAKYDFSFEHGIDVVNMLVEDGLANRLITTRGSYFIFGDGDDAVQWQGRKAMMDAFREDELLLGKLSALLKRQ